MIHHFPFPFKQPKIPPLKHQQQQQQQIVHEICVNCPFNDCSVPLFYNGFEILTDAECPNCHRLFCAQCKVSWHSGLNCQQFQQKQLKSRVYENLDSQRSVSVKRQYPFEECDDEEGENNGMRKKKSATCLMNCPNQQYDLELKAEGNVIKSSYIVGCKKSYCPFKDCSVLLIDDGKEVVTSAECPSCHRLFCAQCKVPWHGGINCEEFQQQQKLKCSVHIRSYDEKKKEEKGKAPAVEFETGNASSTQSLKSFCDICHELIIIESNIVRGSATCNHSFCANCISNHVAAQLSQNIMEVNCPNSKCFEELKPHHLRHVLPEEVLDRWAFERLFIAR